MGHPLGMAPCAEAPHRVGSYPVGGFIQALPVHSLPTIAQQHGLVSFLRAITLSYFNFSILNKILLPES